MVDFLLSCQRPDGGFAENPALPASATAPTVAALASLSLLGEGVPATVGRAIQFLLGMQTPEGGWLASPIAPAPDLLSTAVALMAMVDHGGLAIPG